MSTTEQMQRRAAVILVVFAVIAAVAILLFHRDKPIPSNLADGSYASQECGKLVVRNNTLVSPNSSTYFQFQRLKNGIALLPSRHIYIDRTAKGGRCRILSDGRTSDWLRMDQAARPRWISIADDRGDWVGFDLVQ